MQSGALPNAGKNGNVRDFTGYIDLSGSESYRNFINPRSCRNCLGIENVMELARNLKKMLSKPSFWGQHCFAPKTWVIHHRILWPQRERLPTQFTINHCIIQPDFWLLGRLKTGHCRIGNKT